MAPNEKTLSLILQVSPVEKMRFLFFTFPVYGSDSILFLGLQQQNSGWEPLISGPVLSHLYTVNSPLH